MTWQQDYLNRYYRGKDGWVDGTNEFHVLCASKISQGSSILEIGAGTSNPTSQFLATIGTVVGVDIDPIVNSNKYLSSAFVLKGNAYPFSDSSFDACVSDYVLEHIADPITHLSEVTRVLKPRGVYVFRTPNLFHYVSLVAKLTPCWFHNLISNHLRNLNSENDDPYPTYYRMNSQSVVIKAAKSVGLTIHELRMIEKEPSYGMSFRLLFLAFMMYERIVNYFDFLSVLRVNIFGVLEKPKDIITDGDMNRDLEKGAVRCKG